MSHLPIGTILRSSQYAYEVVEVLGKGGFGVTYKVTSMRRVGNVDAHCTFAMKEHYISEWCERMTDGKEVTCSNPLKERVENSKLDFLAEARRLQQVTHSSIISVDEVFEANNTAYYVMEYLDSGNLDDYVAQYGCLGEGEMMNLLLPVLNAVKTLHNHRMTHLDIKPANIMIKQLPDGGMRPVLIDFGLSKHYDEHGNATSTVRSQGYSDGYAPIEQYAGIDTFSPQSDIYALAATMIYCLTGKRPPRAIDVDDEVLNALIPATVSDSMRYAIIKAMQGARNKRTKSVEELINDISGAQPTSVMPAAGSTRQSGASVTTPVVPVASVTTPSVASTATQVNVAQEPAVGATQVNVAQVEEPLNGDGAYYDEDDTTSKKRTVMKVLFVIIALAVIAAVAIFIMVAIDSTNSQEVYRNPIQNTNTYKYSTELVDTSLVDTSLVDTTVGVEMDQMTDTTQPALVDTAVRPCNYDEDMSYDTVGSEVVTDDYSNSNNVSVIVDNGRSITIINGDTIYN